MTRSNNGGKKVSLHICQLCTLSHKLSCILIACVLVSLLLLHEGPTEEKVFHSETSSIYSLEQFGAVCDLCRFCIIDKDSRRSIRAPEILSLSLTLSLSLRYPGTERSTVESLDAVQTDPNHGLCQWGNANLDAVRQLGEDVGGKPAKDGFGATGLFARRICQEPRSEEKCLRVAQFGCAKVVGLNQ